MGYYTPSFWKWERDGKTQYEFQWMNLKISNPWWDRSIFVGLGDLDVEPMIFSGFIIGINPDRPGFLRMKHAMWGTDCRATGWRACLWCGATYPSERRCLWIWQWFARKFR